jgi:rod shape-determining protein MreD
MVMRVQVEQHIEVHKYSFVAVAGTVFMALVLQASLPVYFPQAKLLELPLLVTLYFGLSRRNPSTGLLLGMVVGLLQDGISRIPVGLYGIAKTLVGFAASSIGARLDVEHPAARALLTFLFFHGHQMVFAFTRGILLQEEEVFFSTELLIASLVNAALSVLLFPLLDFLRKPS